MKIVVRLYLVMELKEVHLHQILLDILSGVNAGASRTAGGIFAGLRHGLFSRVKRPALTVEQVCRWLCHTAVTPILTVRTRSYLLPHVLRPVAIRGRTMTGKRQKVLQ